MTTLSAPSSTRVNRRLITSVCWLLKSLPYCAAAGESQEAAKETPEALQGFLSTADLAAKLGKSPPAVESFLRRYRKDYPDCCIPVSEDDRRRNQPKYLYRMTDVWDVLKNHFKK